MTIKTSCPHCSQGYSLVDTQLGKKIRCKSCSEPFVVRDSEATQNAPPRPHDDADDRPARRKSRRKKRGTPTWIWIVGGIGAVVLVLGCLGGGTLLWVYGPFGNKVTEENWKKLKLGMTQAEVKAILGSPTETNSSNELARGTVSMVWRKDERNNIVAIFLNDKAVQLVSALTGPDGTTQVQTQVDWQGLLNQKQQPRK